jgi:flagella basal body P-ring formation protein FlgA
MTRIFKAFRPTAADAPVVDDNGLLAHRARAAAGRVKEMAAAVVVSVIMPITCALPTAHADIESHQRIIEAARAFVAPAANGNGEDVSIEVGPLDPRLRVAACGHSPETFFPSGSRAYGNTTVGLRCRAPHPWQLYVPVSIKVFERVVVATRPLPRGGVLTAGDLRLERRDVSTLSGGYLVDPAAALGKVLTRPVTLGYALSQNLLKSPQLVRRGERVIIRARTGGMDVQVAGTALANGAAGEVIRVRNRSSKRVVDAVVAGEGLVEVRL